MISWPCRFGPVVRQYVMAGGCGGVKLLTSRSEGDKESKGRTED
jgi:hypothetical protein